MTEVGQLVRDRFAWLGDRTDHTWYADPTGWWRDPVLLSRLGPALAGLAGTRPTVVIGPQSRGCLLGVLVAAHLGVGFVEVRKDDGPACDSEAWLRRTCPPDYRDRQLTLGFPRNLVRGGDRVLFVDDWVATGAQALAAQQLVGDAEATWAGAVTVVDALTEHRVRRQLRLASLVHVRDL